MTRAGHLVGVQSKCHPDQWRAVGVAFHICLRSSIDVVFEVDIDSFDSCAGKNKAHWNGQKTAD